MAAGLPIVPSGCLGRNTKVNRSLAEGRRSFLERYPQIESGRECERLAPLLSAFVDGEADGGQVVELRRHLRGCPACRATVRGHHEVSGPLSVVLPAVGMAVASGGAEQTSSFFVRVYETVTLSLHERTANCFLRAQAIIDTVTAGKMAAAAASAPRWRSRAGRAPRTGHPERRAGPARRPTPRRGVREAIRHRKRRQDDPRPQAEAA
jgi:putative zinc finger protein